MPSCACPFATVPMLHLTSVRKDRLPFGGKRCIVSRLPLPPCCKNGYCTAHLDKPTPSSLSRKSDGDLATAALKIVFARHDVDMSGAYALSVCISTVLCCSLQTETVEIEQPYLPSRTLYPGLIFMCCVFVGISYIGSPRDYAHHEPGM